MSVEDRLREAFRARVRDVRPDPRAWERIERHLTPRRSPAQHIFRSRTLHRLVVVGIALGIAAAGFTLVLLALGPLARGPTAVPVRPGQRPSEGPSVVRAELSATIATQGEAASVSASGSGVWLAVPETDPGAACSGALERIDPTTNALTDVFPLDATPTAVQATPDLVWVAVRPCGEGLPSLLALAPGDGRVLASVEIPVPGGAVVGLARSEGRLWLAIAGPGDEGAVIAVDEASHDIVQRFPVEGRLRDIAVTRGAIWTADDTFESGEWRTALLRVDATSGAVTRLFEGDIVVHPSVFSLGATPSGVWINLGPTTAAFVDETAGATAARFQLPGRFGRFGPFAANDAGVWFSGLDVTENRQAIAWLDARTGAVSTSVPLPAHPTAADVDEGSVWAALYGGGVVRVDFTTSPVSQPDGPPGSSP